MPEPETGTQEVQQLRRRIRDLVALSAFPAVWVGYDLRQIAESLADGLRHMLHLDLVYLAVRDRTGGIVVEVAHTTRRPRSGGSSPGRPQGAGSLAEAQPPGAALIDPRPPRQRDHRDRHHPHRDRGRSGILVAGSRRADFPTEVDRLLLGVGANQAAILLERRRADEALRESEERFRDVRERVPSSSSYTDDRRSLDCESNQSSATDPGLHPRRVARDDLDGLRPTRMSGRPPPCWPSSLVRGERRRDSL